MYSNTVTPLVRRKRPTGTFENDPGAALLLQTAPPPIAAPQPGQPAPAVQPTPVPQPGKYVSDAAAASGILGGGIIAPTGPTVAPQPAAAVGVPYVSPRPGMKPAGVQVTDAAGNILPPANKSQLVNPKYAELTAKAPISQANPEYWRNNGDRSGQQSVRVGTDQAEHPDVQVYTHPQMAELHSDVLASATAKGLPAEPAAALAEEAVQKAATIIAGGASNSYAPANTPHDQSSNIIKKAVGEGVIPGGGVMTYPDGTQHSVINTGQPGAALAPAAAPPVQAPAPVVQRPAVAPATAALKPPDAKTQMYVDHYLRQAPNTQTYVDLVDKLEEQFPGIDLDKLGNVRAARKKADSFRKQIADQEQQHADAKFAHDQGQADQTVRDAATMQQPDAVEAEYKRWIAQHGSDPKAMPPFLRIVDQRVKAAGKPALVKPALGTGAVTGANPSALPTAAPKDDPYNLLADKTGGKMIEQHQKFNEDNLDAAVSTFVKQDDLEGVKGAIATGQAMVKSGQIRALPGQLAALADAIKRDPNRVPWGDKRLTDGEQERLKTDAKRQINGEYEIRMVKEKGPDGPTGRDIQEEVQIKPGATKYRTAADFEKNLNIPRDAALKQMYDGGNGCEGLKARYEAFKDANKRLKPEEIDDRWNAALREPGNTDLYQAWITHHKGAKEAASQPVQVDRKAAFSRATTALVNGTPIAPNDYNALDTEQRKELVRLRAKSKAATQTGAH